MREVYWSTLQKCSSINRFRKQHLSTLSSNLITPLKMGLIHICFARAVDAHGQRGNISKKSNPPLHKFLRRREKWREREKQGKHYVKTHQPRSTQAAATGLLNANGFFWLAVRQRKSFPIQSVPKKVNSLSTTILHQCSLKNIKCVRPHDYIASATACRVLVKEAARRSRNRQSASGGISFPNCHSSFAKDKTWRKRNKREEEKK